MELTGRWHPLADGVYARRYAHLDLTLGLVVGDRRCLVVDTGCDERHGAELAAAVRAVTRLAWTVVLTHAHFDHYFGTAAFGDCPVWAHERCRDALVHRATADRGAWVERYRRGGEVERAERLAAARLVLPEHLLTRHNDLDLGGRTVRLLHPGPAHTDHDVAVHVPDAGVVFAGDLVEHEPGGSFTAESFGHDTTLPAWPAALDGLLELAPHTVVPGHGEPVGAAFVAAEREHLARLAELCAGALERERVAARSPYRREVTTAALDVSRSSARRTWSA